MAMTTKSKSEPAPPATEATLKAVLDEARRAWGQAQRAADSAESPLERLEARRKLPECVARAEAAEYQLAQFQAGAVEQEQHRRAAVIAKYDPEIKQRLAHLLPILEQAETAMLDYRRFAADADHRLGGFAGRYALLAFSALVSDMHSESALTSWRRYLRQAGWLD